MGLFKEFLPCMPRIKYEGLSAVSHENYLLVADGKLGDIDVYDGHIWASAQPIPKEITHQRMNSAVVDGRWYLTGGDKQEKRIYYAPIESLIASCHVRISQSLSIWKSLPDLPCKNSKLACFDRRLIAVGKEDSSSIYVYSFHTQLWIHMFDLPTTMYSFCPFAIVVLTSGELMVVYPSFSDDAAVVKAALKSMTLLVSIVQIHVFCVYHFWLLGSEGGGERGDEDGRGGHSKLVSRL